MTSFLRFDWCVLAFLGAINGVSLLHAQGAFAPPSPATEPPSLTTNAEDSSFLENHSDTAPSSPSPQPGLTLPPSPTPESAAPASSSSPGAPPNRYNLTIGPGEPEDLASHLLVVYNQNDFDSKNLAEYYASRRNIPAERVLPINCPENEEITHAEYDKTIREPILFYLLQKNWMVRQNAALRLGARTLRLIVATHNDIWAIVLIRGVPLKIAPDPSDDDTMESQATLQTNAAAVDSELALLPVFGLPRGGFVPNVFFDSKGTSSLRVGDALARNMILVSRLDGPAPADVRRMIDDSLYAEKNRLAGLAVIDTRGIADVKNPFVTGDIWLRNAANMLVRDGWPLKFDATEAVLPATDPCNQVAFYMGWYTGDAAGPWITPPNRFVPGAIAYHLHSFSAATVRSPTQNWVGPLIAHGADATMGTVYEPYLAFTPHEDIFTKHILDGDYFVEAAYASVPGLSWMVTVVGDPLYRPFRLPLASALAGMHMPHSTHDDWLLLQAVRRAIFARQIEAKTDRLQASLNVPGAGPVAEEGLGDLLLKLNDPQAGYSVDQAYKQAMASYTLPMDRIRVALKLAQYYINHGQDNRAQAQMDMLRQQFPEECARFGVPGGMVPTGASPSP